MMAGLSDNELKFLKNRPVKFMATIGDDGWPNVVPLLSVTPWDKDTLCFVRLMVWKTRKNLEDRKKVAVSALGLTSSLEILGEFTGFEKSGAKLEFFNTQPIYRYNAYFGAGQVGVIKVVGDKGWSKAALWRLLQARLISGENGAHSCGPEVMPQVVAEKFQRILAAKFISWIDDSGWPRLMPAQGAFPIGANKMGIAGCRSLFAKLEPGKPLALSVLATEPISYQVKGKFAGIQARNGLNFAMIDLEKSYSCAPPLPGEQIYPR
jgi:hypothetical protein